MTPRVFLFRAAVTLAALMFSAPTGAEAEDPFPESVRKSAQKLRRLVEGMHKYHDEHGGKLPGPALLDGQGTPVLSWRVALLPYLGEEALYREFRRDEPWDSPHNKALIGRMPAVYAPVGDVKAEPGTTFYRAFVGKGTAFDPGEALDYPDFTDGTVTTLAVVEAGKSVPWTKPEDLPYSAARPLPELGGLFEDGFTAALVSGDVRFFDKKVIDEPTLRALITRNGGEVVSLDRLPGSVDPLR